ncbi:MAG: hypothetical protein E1N59_316 [Puniceicoccaceae bacterium 5H]|nr:MAG: hypothetical protein E1N59_316 [Puniceicoccaceae bacterium 5H]
MKVKVAIVWLMLLFGTVLHGQEVSAVPSDSEFEAIISLAKTVFIAAAGLSIGMAVYVYTKHQVMDPDERRMWKKRLEVGDHSDQEAYDRRKRELDSSW